MLITNQGYTITNYALPLHIFCCGDVRHNLYEDRGAMYLYTVGCCENRDSLTAWANGILGGWTFRGMHREFLEDVRSRIAPGQ